MAHVVVLETEVGVVLVDTGFGTRDAEQWRRRLGMSQYALRPVYREGETAVAQLAALGTAAGEVRHVVLTHFDADHVGGLADFPAAPAQHP